MLKGKQLLAYTAGIIDGEGCICISTHKNDTKRGYSYQLFVTVKSTNEWLIHWLKMQYGGILGSQKGKGKFSDTWTWTLSSNKAMEFLKLISSYLYIKRPHAEIAIAYQSRQHNRTKSDDEVALFEAERILLSKLNHRGK